jgi:MtrB/PioB family decaheme-associated outer membrane protein
MTWKRATLLARCLGVTSVAIASAALAQQPDTSSWVCEYCPFADGYRADYEAGTSYVTGDAAHFGDAGGYNEQGAYLNLDGSGSYASENYQAQWLAEDLGLDSRYLSVSGGNQGSYGYRIAYRELPRHRFDTTQTIFQQASPDSLSLPPGWVRSPVTGGFSALGASLVDRDISSERRVLELGGRYLPSDRFRVSASYRRQERDGLRIAGGSYFTQSSLLPAPFDHATDEAELGLRYSGGQGYLKLAYLGSFFQNENLALRWETPFTSAVGAETGAQAQSPDNSFQQISLAGNYRVHRYDTVFGLNLARGRLEQDDSLLPYTSNPLLTTSPLPRQRLDGRVHTTNVALTMSTRPFDKARIRLAYRLDDRDNRTSVDAWARVITDTFNSGDVETNVPYSFRKTRFNALGSYQLRRNVRVSAGFDRIEYDRDFQEVAEQTETGGWGMLRWKPNDYLDIRAKGGATEREIDRYDETVAVSLGQNPLLRKYHLAYRYRRFGELTLAAALPEKPVSLTVTAMYADDEYTQSRLGITDGDDLRVAGDLSFALADNRYLYLHGGYENIESDQLGSEQFATADWSARNTDRFYSAGGGLILRQIAGSFDVTLDYTRAMGSTEISLNTLAAGLGWFPDLESTMDSVRLRLVWHRSEQLAVNLGLRYEGFEAEDWALEGVAPDTVPVVLTTGAKPYDYDVVLVGIGFTYLLDTQKSSGSDN